MENFQKEILFEANSSEEMFEKERELVEIGSHSYNLKEGGYGGWDHLNNGSQEHIERVKKAGCILWSRIEDKRAYMVKNGMSGNNSRNHMIRMRLRAQDEDVNKRRKETMKKNNHSQGTKNSQYGTMWITDGSSNRKIKKEEVIPEGWRKGRFIK